MATLPSPALQKELAPQEKILWIGHPQTKRYVIEKGVVQAFLAAIALVFLLYWEWEKLLRSAFGIP